VGARNEYRDSKLSRLYLEPLAVVASDWLNR